MTILVSNHGLALLLDENLRRVGPPRFDEQETAFARELEVPVGAQASGAALARRRSRPGNPGSKTLAASAIELFTTPAQLEAARKDFHAVRDPLRFVTLVPEGQKAPASIR